jgi:hypothetical protein
VIDTLFVDDQVTVLADRFDRVLECLFIDRNDLSTSIVTIHWNHTRKVIFDEGAHAPPLRCACIGSVEILFFRHILA